MKSEKMRELLRFKKDDIISVFDIESETVKLAQIRISGAERSLHKLVAVKAASTKPADVAKVIHELSVKFKLSGSLVLVKLPRYMVTVRDIQLPSINREELEGMIDLQSSKMFPYPKEEIIYGYKLIDTTPEGYSRIMVVLTHKDVVEKILNLFKLSGLEINKIALSTEALSNWYLSKQPSETENTLITLMEIDSTSADIQMIYNGKVEFTRAVTFSREERTPRLIDELSRSFYKYQKKLNPDNQRLVLTGPESIIAEDAPLLKREFNMPTVYINPLKAWRMDKDCMIPSENTMRGVSFATTLALGFNFDKLDLNFLPARIQKAKTGQLMKEALFVTGFLSLCIILGFGGIVWKKIDDKSRILKSLNARIEKSEPEVQRLTNMVVNLNMIKKQLDMRGTSIDVIRELYRLIPPKISLTILDFEEDVSCTLRGTADELSSVFKLNTILEKSPYFKNVKVRYATKRAVRGQTMTDFEIICGLREGHEIAEVRSDI